MFKKGLELMEELFPGYKQELSQAGALAIDQIRDIYFVICSSSQYHDDVQACCCCIHLLPVKHAMRQLTGSVWIAQGQLALHASLQFSSLGLAPQCGQDPGSIAVLHAGIVQIQCRYHQTYSRVI